MRESVWYVGKGRGGRGLSMMEWSAVEWMGGGVLVMKERLT